MRASILNWFLLGFSHAQDGSDDIPNFKIENCNAADKERLSIDLFRSKPGMRHTVCGTDRLMLLITIYYVRLKSYN